MTAMTLLLALCGSAHAEDTETGWSTTGELRELLSTGTDFEVDADGTTIGQGAHLDQRLRVGASHKGFITHFETEWDLFTGQLAGDTWDIARSGDERRRDVHGALTLGGLQPRKLSVGGYVGNADVEIGLMTSHWGLGLVANDGDHQPLFGREDFGDRVLRAKVTMLPWKTRVGAAAPTFIVLAVDTVFADDLALLSEGQVANQAVAAILHDPGEDATKWGLYGVFRNQLEPGMERATQAGVLDAFGSHPIELNDELTLTLAAESVGIMGRTSRAQSYNATDGLALRSGALVTKATLESPRFDAHLNLGASSADGRPDDKRSLDFTADRDFGVGMVLFDEVMGGIDAGTHSLLTDPVYSGQAPDGVELVANEGAWRRAAYIQPAIAVRPIDQLELKVGMVSAISTGPIAQPFYSFRNGGVPRNHLNQDTAGKRGLGNEINWALSLQPKSTEVMEEEWKVQPRLEIQGGHAMLSEALGGGTVSLVQSALRVDW